MSAPASPAKRNRRNRRAAAAEAPVETTETTPAAPVEETTPAQPEDVPAAGGPAAKPGGATVVLEKGVKNTMPDSRLVKAEKGRQIHVLAKGETVTICGIDTTGWTKLVEIDDATGVTCPVCVDALARMDEANKALEAATKAAAKAEEVTS